MLKFIGVIMVLCFISCTDKTKEAETGVTEEVVETVSLDSLNFTIKQPKGWVCKVNFRGSKLFMIDNTCDSCKLKPIITVVKFSNKDSLNLEGVVDYNISSTKTYYQNFNLIENQDVNLNGINAKRVVYTAQNKQQDSIGVVSYMFMLNEKEHVYFINCTGENKGDAFKNKVAFFDEVCQTFRFN